MSLRNAALYLILIYAAARTLDFVITASASTAITIMSDAARHPDRITRDLGGRRLRRLRGCEGTEQDILYCVVTRLEIGKVKAIVRELDERAFVVLHPLSTVEGGVKKAVGFH